MKTIFINGRFLTQNITGVQRYALEIVKAMDKLLNANIINNDYKFVVLTPKNIKHKISLKNISVKQVGSFKGHFWEQIELPYFSRDGFLINFCNCAPIFKSNQSITIHDAATMVMPRSFSLAFKLWYRFMYFVLKNRLNLIFTVSEYSKKDLNKFFGIDLDKIRITYNGIEHISKIVPDERIIEKNNINRDMYVLAVSSMNPSKNFKLILEAANRIKDCQFVIAGGANPNIFNTETFNVPTNVKFVGYVSDEELMALYKHAYCFVYPSLYEGFGIPPLEAIAFECPVILSDIDVFREIYGDNALYCDAFCVESLEKQILNSNDLHKLKEAYKYNGFVNKYSWKATTEVILHNIFEVG